MSNLIDKLVKFEKINEIPLMKKLIDEYNKKIEEGFKQVECFIIFIESEIEKYINKEKSSIINVEVESDQISIYFEKSFLYEYFISKETTSEMIEYLYCKIKERGHNLSKFISHNDGFELVFDI